MRRSKFQKVAEALSGCREGDEELCTINAEVSACPEYQSGIWIVSAGMSGREHKIESRQEKRFIGQKECRVWCGESSCLRIAESRGELTLTLTGV